MPAPTSLARYLDALYATAPTASLIELRVRATGGMTQDFFPAEELESVVAAVDRLAPHADTFVGVLPRRRHGGGRSDLVADGDVVWVDCDTDESVTALERFTPPASILVASGTGGHRHAYWLLRERISISGIEATNRALASALRADRSCVDAARILRPPSANHKHEPPARVRLLRCRPAERHPLDRVERAAGLAPAPYGGGSFAPGLAHAPRDATGDPLLALPPAVYIQRLTGVAVPRSRKVRCLFHEDRTPSLHVYTEAGRGWYCFGCGRGGSIYDFASHLWDLTPRGAGFAELRNRLSLMLG